MSDDTADRLGNDAAHRRPEESSALEQQPTYAVDPTDDGAAGDLPTRRIGFSGLTSSVEFEDLIAPEPVEADPSSPARWLAFIGVLIGGLLGALVGYGIGDILYPDSIWSAVGGLGGAAIGAAGLGVLANLTLRAMSEWRSVVHPESSGGSNDRPPIRRTRS